MPSFTGQFFRRGDEGFDGAAFGRIFNRHRPARRPAAVLRAADAADVAAGADGWQVAVRAGGHSWAAWSLRENALLIDLGAVTGMDYDESTGIVTVGPAVRGGTDLDPFLAGRDRFFASGHCPTVGLGGFLLQGGMGWNCRGWGWAAESIEAIQVVTADGDVLWCDQSENADLFWAARGSGPGFFGVVTAFRLRTRPRYRELTQTTYVYPAEAAPEVLGWLHTDDGLDGRPRDFYGRQLWDWKFSANVDTMTPKIMGPYVEMCAWTLARAHARSGDRVAIASYLGGSDVFDGAIADFAELYADQSERDYESLLGAIESGRVVAETGI